MVTSAYSEHTPAPLSDAEFESRLNFLYKPLLRLAERQVGSNYAEDLVQDTQIRAWRIKREFVGRDNDALFHWLAKILDFQVLHFLRKQRNNPETLLPAHAILALCDGPDERPLEEGIWLEQRAELRRRIANLVLTPRQRYCVEAWMEGSSFREIGESLEPPISKQAVGKIIQRVEKMLEELDSEADDPLILSSIANWPAAVTYRSPKGVWDRRGTREQIEARRYRIAYTHYTTQHGEIQQETLYDVIDRATPAERECAPRRRGQAPPDVRPAGGY